MSFADLSISGSPTPRANSRQAVSARHQNVRGVSQKQMTNTGGAAAVVTKEQVELAKKLAYYESQVEHARRELKEKKMSTKQSKVTIANKTKGGVPPLRLEMLKAGRANTPDYHEMSGADTSRSVMSWGGNSYRQVQPAGIKNIDTQHLGEEEAKHLGEEEAKHLGEEEAEEEDITYRSQRKPSGKGAQSRDSGGGCEEEWCPAPLSQTAGCELYETEEERVKRGRREGRVAESMLHDLTQPETTSSSSSARYTLSTPWATSDRADFYALNELPRIKRLDNGLHATSKEFTYTHLKDRGIDKRLQFRLRIISRCGKDCLRDLYGYFFPTDNSVTVYECREIGKKLTAAPLFPRAVYRHVRGQWAGNPYTLRDLKIGNTLHFPTTNNTALSPSITRSPYVLLRIASVSQEEVLNLLHDGCRPEERNAREAALVNTITKEEICRLQRIEEIQKHIARQLRSRPVRALVGLGHYFVMQDKDKDGFWRSDELQAVLRTFRIQLPYQDFQTLWSYLDEDGSGLIDVGEFLRGLLGEMSEARLGLVNRAWCRMDPSKVGYVTYVTVRHFYNPVLSLDTDAPADLSREEMMEEFLSCFSSGPLNERITYAEFVDYHTALSLSEQDDPIFAHFMKTSWNI